MPHPGQQPGMPPPPPQQQMPMWGAPGYYVRISRRKKYSITDGLFANNSM
jgi:hypothetical protein